MDRSLRHGSVEGLSPGTPLQLSAEQRSMVHILVVEDKYVPFPAPPAPPILLIIV
jgi:hypothetical protein